MDILKQYCSALEDVGQFKYESPNTRRRKLEAISTVLNYFLENENVNDELIFHGKMKHAKNYINSEYKKTSSMRDQWLSQQHSQSKLDSLENI